MTEFDISLSLSIEGSLACEDILFQKCFFSFFFSPAKQMHDLGCISNIKVMCPHHCPISDFANRFLLNTENKDYMKTRISDYHIFLSIEVSYVILQRLSNTSGPGTHQDVLVNIAV